MSIEATEPTRTAPNLNLSALRGAAALLIVIGHYLNAIEGLFDVTEWWYRFTPLRLIGSTRFATILFFALTSFLLCGGVSRRGYDAGRYLSGRFVRIYIPFAVSIVVAWLACNAVGTDHIRGATDNINADWDNSEDVDDLLRHLALLGRREDTNLVGVGWSLIFQFRIWLFLPLIVFCLMRSSLYAALGLALALGSAIGAGALGQSNYYYGDTIGLSLLLTPYFLLPTLAGTLAWLHRDRVHRCQTILAPLLLAVVGAIAISRIHTFVVRDVLYAALAGLVIVLVARARSQSVTWVARLLVRIGTISFPLYLYHVTVVIVVFQLFQHWVPLAWLLLPSFLVSLLMAQLVHRFIDRPLSDWWGRVSGPDGRLWNGRTREAAPVAIRRER